MAGNNIRPLKVMFLCAHSELVGGGQQSLIMILRHLDRNRVEPLVVCPAEGGFSRGMKELDIPTRFLPLPDPKGAAFWKQTAAMHRIARLAFREEADFIDGDTVEAGLYAALAARMAGAKAVFHARVSDSGRWWDWLLPRLCDGIICVSKATTERFSPPVGCRVEVIYSGAAPKNFSARDREYLRNRFGIPQDSFCAVFAGQLVREKGAATLLRAIAKLPSATCLIAGEGPESGPLQLLAEELGIRERTVFTGKLSDARDAYGAGDVTVLPTAWKEGLARVIIESMACGRAVLATPLGGNAEALADGMTGYMIQPDDPDGLARRLAELDADRETLARLGHHAKERALEMFSPRACALSHEEFYISLSDRGRTK